MNTRSGGRFENEYWPGHHFIDSNGKVRHHHFGEGDYAESERVIQRLLAEAGNKNVLHLWLKSRSRAMVVVFHALDPLEKRPRNMLISGAAEERP